MKYPLYIRILIFMLITSTFLRIQSADPSTKLADMNSLIDVKAYLIDKVINTIDATKLTPQESSFALQENELIKKVLYTTNASHILIQTDKNRALLLTLDKNARYHAYKNIEFQDCVCSALSLDGKFLMIYDGKTTSFYAENNEGLYNKITTESSSIALSDHITHVSINNNGSRCALLQSQGIVQGYQRTKESTYWKKNIHYFNDNVLDIKLNNSNSSLNILTKNEVIILTPKNLSDNQQISIGVTPIPISITGLPNDDFIVKSLVEGNAANNYSFNYYDNKGISILTKQGSDFIYNPREKIAVITGFEVSELQTGIDTNDDHATIFDWQFLYPWLSNNANLTALRKNDTQYTVCHFQLVDESTLAFEQFEQLDQAQANLINQLYKEKNKNPVLSTQQFAVFSTIAEHLKDLIRLYLPFQAPVRTDQENQPSTETTSEINKDIEPSSALNQTLSDNVQQQKDLETRAQQQALLNLHTQNKRSSYETGTSNNINTAEVALSKSEPVQPEPWFGTRLLTTTKNFFMAGYNRLTNYFSRFGSWLVSKFI